jgi:hypothetical protein
MKSPLSQTHASVKKVYKIGDSTDKPSSFVNLNQDYSRHKILNYYYEYLKPQTLFTIDINKCRKNILYYGKYRYCVFTVFDKLDEFKGASIRPGLYYVETDNYMPLRGNGWHYHNMICYCIENDIMKLDHIKYVIKSSLSLPKNYYNKLNNFCYNNIENYSKLAINSMIGNFKPNLSERETWFTSSKDYEPQYIESDFGDMSFNPKYNINNQLKTLKQN